MTAIIPFTEKVKRKGRGLFETETDRRNQSRAMLALLRRWDLVHGLKYDAVHIDDEIDYIIVAEGSYTSGPLPSRAAGQIEYKRRYGDFHFPDVFMEQRKQVALTSFRDLIGGVPIFVTEWDDVVLVLDARLIDGLPLRIMIREDRNLKEDRDWGYYVPSDRLFVIEKP